MESESRLIRQIKNGDRSAAEELFKRYEIMLFNYMFRVIGHRDLAQDAVQESFISAFKGIAKYRDQGQFKSWLFRIGHRQAMRLLMRRQVDPLIVDEQLLQSVEDQQSLSLSEMVERDQCTRALEFAIAQLKWEEREVVLLRVSQDMSFKAIAFITGVPINTALGRMHAATRKLQDWFRTREAE